MAFYDEPLTSVFDIRFNFIRVKLEDHVFSLTLARPDKRNAFTPVMVCEIAYALQFANESSEVWVVCIDAEGPVFCAGMDLNVFNNPALDTPNPDIPLLDIPLAEAVAQLNKPSVAIVEGPVLAGGFLIAGECTFVIGGNDARFSLPEVKRGIFPMQVMATLSKILSRRRILEMCILAKEYSPQEAREMGLITELADDPREAAAKLIEGILNNAPYAIRTGIAALKELDGIPEASQQAFLKSELSKIRHSEDAREGFEAFKAKKKPHWKNR